MIQHPQLTNYILGIIEQEPPTISTFRGKEIKGEEKIVFNGMMLNLANILIMGHICNCLWANGPTNTSLTKEVSQL